MNLMNAELMDEFKTAHPDASDPLTVWEANARVAVWKHLLDLRKTYPSADGVTAGKGATQTIYTVFNIKGNNYRLITTINYQTKNVWLNAFMTHAEYDKENWKKA